MDRYTSYIGIFWQKSIKNTYDYVFSIYNNVTKFYSEIINNNLTV